MTVRAVRSAMLGIMALVTGCGAPDDSDTPQAPMPARTWRYFVAHPPELEAMQATCRTWAGSGAPAGAEPAVVTTNCRAAAFAKSQLQRIK